MESNTNYNESNDDISYIKLKMLDIKINYRFILSIILTVFGITILSLLVIYVPLPDFVIDSSTEQSFDGTNFFYKWIYNSQYFNNEWHYYFNIVKASTGYFVFTPIAIVLLTISGSTVLCKRYQNSKLIIFTNWILYTIPIIIVFVKSISTQFNYSFNNNIQFFIFGLTFYPLYQNFMLQLGIITFKQSFTDLLMMKKKDGIQSKIPLIRKIILNSTFFAIYIYSAVLPLTFVRQYDFAESTDILFSILWFLPILWFVLLVYMKNMLVIRRFILEIIAVILPLVIIFAATFIIDSILSDREFDNIIYQLFKSTEISTVIWALLIKTASGLFIGLIIGFFSRKKVRYIILTIYIIIILVYFYIFFGFLFSFKYFLPSMKAYAILGPIMCCTIISIGFLLGIYLSRDYWTYKSIFYNKGEKGIESSSTRELS